MLVVDASVIATAIADGGRDGMIRRHRLRGENLNVPDFARVEVMSAIRSQMNRRPPQLSRAQARTAVEDLIALRLMEHPTRPLLARAWEIQANVAPYDGCYVALAETLGCRLLTDDRRLARASGPLCAFEIV